jgi:hypothetical protein
VEHTAFVQSCLDAVKQAARALVSLALRLGYLLLTSSHASPPQLHCPLALVLSAGCLRRALLNRSPPHHLQDVDDAHFTDEEDDDEDEEKAVADAAAGQVGSREAQPDSAGAPF